MYVCMCVYVDMCVQFVSLTVYCSWLVEGMDKDGKERGKKERLCLGRAS